MAQEDTAQFNLRIPAQLRADIAGHCDKYGWKLNRFQETLWGVYSDPKLTARRLLALKNKPGYDARLDPVLALIQEQDWLRDGDHDH